MKCIYMLPMYAVLVVVFYACAVQSIQLTVQDGIMSENTPLENTALNKNASSIEEKSFEEAESPVKANDVPGNAFVNEFHIQLEEGKHIAENSVSAAVDGVEVSPTARGEEQPSSVNSQLSERENVTANTTNPVDESNTTSTLISCAAGKETVVQPVELVNSTRLLNLLITEPNVTNRRSMADCIALLFYARYCPFSSMAAPHFNALSRAFPDIKMAAVDAMKHHSFNTQYGIVGVPTVMLFHNGRPAAKFNDSEYTLEMFSRFLTKYTGMEPQGKLYVMSADFGGPVPSVPVKETDYCLALSWTFILVCGIYFFSKSTWWRWIVESVQNTWREAEAQHEHAE